MAISLFLYLMSVVMLSIFRLVWLVCDQDEPIPIVETVIVILLGPIGALFLGIRALKRENGKRHRALQEKANEEFDHLLWEHDQDRYLQKHAKKQKERLLESHKRDVWIL